MVVEFSTMKVEHDYRYPGSINYRGTNYRGHETYRGQKADKLPRRQTTAANKLPRPSPMNYRADKLPRPTNYRAHKTYRGPALLITAELTYRGPRPINHRGLPRIIAVCLALRFHRCAGLAPGPRGFGVARRNGASLATGCGLRSG